MILQKLRAYVSVFGFYAAIVAIPLLFNNCGQRAFYSREAFIPVTKLESELVKTYGAALSPAMCAVGEKYSCQHKVFGVDIADGEAISEFKCVDIDGAQICAHGKTYSYNSAAAQAGCKEGCDEDYNYEEYFCSYELTTVDGVHPLQATAATIEESIRAVHEACVRVGEAAQGVE